MIDIVFRNLTADRTFKEGFFINILEMAEQELKLKDRVSISVNLVGEDKILELNRKYRNEDKPADVLSFPTQEKLEIGNWKLKIDKDVGDVFICLSIAKNKAKRENITVKEKLARLVVHGFLHLLGHDHDKSKRGAEKKFKVDDKIIGTKV